MPERGIGKCCSAFIHPRSPLNVALRLLKKLYLILDKRAEVGKGEQQLAEGGRVSCPLLNTEKKIISRMIH